MEIIQKILWFDLEFYDKDSDTCIQYLNSNPFKMTKTLNTNMAFVQGFFWTTLLFIYFLKTPVETVWSCI